MPTIYSGISSALQAMLTNQQAIEITGHNVANANTAGYHRQSAVLAAGMPYSNSTLIGSTYAGQMGTGVVVDKIRRYAMEYVDGRYRKELAESKRWETEQAVLEQVEATLAETEDDGLVTKLDEFWTGWQSLSDDPTNTALRSDLLEKAQGLTDALNWRANALLSLQQDQNLAIQENVDEINSIASQIASLNSEIVNVQSSGNEPNDLLDTRDQLLDRLAEIAGATSNVQDNGEVTVSIGGHALVVGSKTFNLSTIDDATNPQNLAITWDDGQSFDVTRGELAGIFDARDNVIPDQMEALNTVAKTLVDNINPLNYNGYGLNNSTNHYFFNETFTSTNYALEIRINDDILSDTGNIATAYSSDSPGDGNLAGDIGDLRESLLINGNATINGYYTQKIGELGLAVNNAETKATDRATVVDSLGTMRESVGGVSLDEEAANMVKYQRAYQAAARILTTLDGMLDTVINNMGA